MNNDAKYITLAEEEANYILGTLSDLPIRHLAIVQLVQAFLAKKFVEVAMLERENDAVHSDQ